MRSASLQLGVGHAGGLDTCPSVTYNATTNRMSTVGSVTVTYDNAGNQTNEPTSIPTGGYTWDAENRMTSATINGSTTTYTYNAFGQRAGSAESVVFRLCGFSMSLGV